MSLELSQLCSQFLAKATVCRLEDQLGWMSESCKLKASNSFDPPVRNSVPHYRCHILAMHGSGFGDLRLQPGPWKDQWRESESQLVGNGFCWQPKFRAECKSSRLQGERWRWQDATVATFKQLARGQHMAQVCVGCCCYALLCRHPCAQCWHARRRSWKDHLLARMPVDVSSMGGVRANNRKPLFPVEHTR